MRAGCSDADITSIKEGFKEALGKPILAVLSFRDFAQTFSWFSSTLHMMSQVEGHHLECTFPWLSCPLVSRTEAPQERALINHHAHQPA